MKARSRKSGNQEELILASKHQNQNTNKIIAFCGTRGLPANYGGFETTIDEITKRFIRAGYGCDVFCRSNCYNNTPKTDIGRNLIYVEGSKNRTLDTFISSMQTARLLWKNRRRYHYVFWFNNANLSGILMSAIQGLPMSINTDGLEWRRAKWSWPFKIYYIVSTFLICRLCRSLISDSVGIQTYCRRKFFKKTSLMPNGIPDILTVSG